jgi:putative ABC transport system permease protein
MNIKNNIFTGIRHLKTDKTNTFINIIGLALGMGIVSVVLTFVLNETGYNSSFKNTDRIFRILNLNSIDNKTWGNTPFILGETLKNEVAEVENYVHQYNIGDFEIEKGDNFILENSMLCTDESFFDIFGVKVLQGSLENFNNSEGNILLCRSIADKYFINGDAVGKTLKIKAGGVESRMTVAAVFTDLPKNSSFKASVVTNSDFGMKHLARTVISTSSIKLNVIDFKQSWTNGQFFTNFILLEKGTSEKELEAKLKKIGTEHSDAVNSLAFSLQPLPDIYFGSSRITDNNSGDLGNRSMLYALASTGLLILIIACINYLNLTSAQALTYTKNLAVRKVCGAPRRALMNQMILESVLLSLIALPFALLLAHLSLPFISQMLDKSYRLTLSYQFILSMGTLILITIFTGAVSGLILSYKITSFNLVDSLKGKNRAIGKRFSLRKVMIVFQISVFIILFAVMVLVQKQVHYAFTKDMGFAREGLIRVPLGDHNYELFKQEARKNPYIISVSGAMWMPPYSNHMSIKMPRVDEPDKLVSVDGLFVDYGFATTMGINILQGNDFDETKVNEGILVNELAVKALGLKNVIGEKTVFGTVAGVVPDFNMHSLHEAVRPLIIGLNPSMCRNIAVRIKTDDIQKTIASIKKIWSGTGGSSPFEFDFTNDILRKMYESDIRFSKTIGFLAAVAILIAGLGLFGLSLLSGRQRVKEIGVRKVMGARITEVIAWLNRDFIVCVGIAFVIAIPAAWYIMNRWLETFAYKTGLTWWIFAAAGLLALIITLLTISWQSWKAATRNPVEALRYE